eukprot:SAG25_NODE_11301_length_308_cov_0.315789_1_plen_60_part_10
MSIGPSAPWPLSLKDRWTHIGVYRTTALMPPAADTSEQLSSLLAICGKVVMPAQLMATYL